MLKLLQRLDPKPAVCLKCHKRYRTMLDVDDHVEQACGRGNSLDLAYFAPRPLTDAVPTVNAYNYKKV